MAEIKLGDIYFAKLPDKDKAQRGIQSGVRPVVVISNNKGNRFSPTVIIVPLTSKIKKTNMSTHCIIEANENNGLKRDSVALGECITTIPKTDLLQKIGELTATEADLVRGIIMFATGDDELLKCSDNISITTVSKFLTYMITMLKTQRVA